jgi:hypothetical protein
MLAAIAGAGVGSTLQGALATRLGRRQFGFLD